jgi:hypothetical protein
LTLGNQTTNKIIAISAVQATESYNINLPATIGAAGQILATNGSGNAFWLDPPSTGGSVSFIGVATVPPFLYVNGVSTDGTYTSKTFTLSMTTITTDYGGTGLSTVGMANQVLTSNGTTLYWATPTTGTVTSVTATAPLFSSGGAAPNISCTTTGTGITLVLSYEPTVQHLTSDYIILTDNQDANSTQGTIISTGGVSATNLYLNGSYHVPNTTPTPLLAPIFVNTIKGGSISSDFTFTPTQAATLHIAGPPTAGTNVNFTGSAVYSLICDGNSSFSGSVTVGGAVSLDGTTNINGLTNFNGFVSFGESILSVPAAIVSNMIMYPTLPSTSHPVPVPTLIRGTDSFFVNQWELGWSTTNADYILKIGTLTNAFMDSNSLSFFTTSSVYNIFLGYNVTDLKYELDIYSGVNTATLDNNSLSFLTSLVYNIFIGYDTTELKNVVEVYSGLNTASIDSNSLSFLTGLSYNIFIGYDNTELRHVVEVYNTGYTSSLSATSLSLSSAFTKLVDITADLDGSIVLRDFTGIGSTTITPNGIKTEYTPPVPPLFFAADFSAMSDPLPFVEMQYASIVFNSGVAPILTFNPTNISTIAAFSIGAATDLSLSGGAASQLTAVGNLTLTGGAAAELTATADLALSAGGAAELTAGGLLTLTSSTMTLTTGAVNWTTGLITFEAPITFAAPLGVPTAFTIGTSGGAINIGTIGGLIDLNAGVGAMTLTTGAGIMTFTVGAGGMVMTVLAGGISMITTVGGVKISCGTGDSELSAAVGACFIYAPVGGINVGDSGHRNGHFIVYCENGATAPGTANCEFYTSTTGANTGPGNFIVNTTSAYTGDMILKLKGDLIYGLTALPKSTSKRGALLLSGGGYNNGLIDIPGVQTWLDPGSINQILTITQISNTATSSSGSLSSLTLTVSGGLTNYPKGSSVTLSGFLPTAYNSTFNVNGGNSTQIVLDLSFTYTAITALGVVTADVPIWASPSITSVSAFTPLVSSGGSTPQISLPPGTLGQILTSSNITNTVTGYSNTLGAISTLTVAGTYYVGDYVVVSGFTPSGINGTKLIISIGSGTVTFTCSETSASVLGTVSIIRTAWNVPATSGTVTSVAATVPTFLSISGSPITSSGTLAITYNTGTALPTANGGTGLTTVGTTNQVLTSNGTTLSWTTPTVGTVTS